ncbi:hypothetical protein B7494_g6436 [Chlorociboria aeruginascens]|nr:hypothetical protein B7494_g6436 [Chlorociboria aeruginascens]
MDPRRGRRHGDHRVKDESEHLRARDASEDLRDRLREKVLEHELHKIQQRREDRERNRIPPLYEDGPPYGFIQRAAVTREGPPRLPIDQRDASKPCTQFKDQVRAEMNEIWHEMKADGTCKDDFIRFRVMESWMEQGIWNDKWVNVIEGGWKHEEPLELESESESCPEAEFFLPDTPKFKRPKSDEKKRQIAKRLAVRERQREASRPYYQFLYQVSYLRYKSLVRYREEPRLGWGQRGRHEIPDNEIDVMQGPYTADINTGAYEEVKRTWIHRGIWNEKWGILPGMTWKHEDPLEDEAAGGPAPVLENLLTPARKMLGLFQRRDSDGCGYPPLETEAEIFPE